MFYEIIKNKNWFKEKFDWDYYESNSKSSLNQIKSLNTNFIKSLKNGEYDKIDFS